jgi:hypothetical protein
VKDVNDLYKGNYKLLEKEIKDYRIWKDLPCSWIGRINIVKMTIPPKQSTCSIQFPLKSQWFITEIEKSTSKFVWKHKGLPRQYYTKNAILEISQYSTSNYPTDPQQ